jgi:DNA polymerase I
VSLTDFFAEDDKPREEKKMEEIQSPEPKIVSIETKEKVKTKIKPFNPKLFTLGQDIENVFLLDVRYDAESNKAQCLFYHEETQSIYKWNDNTGHLPYLYTLMSKDSVQKISQVNGSKELVKIDEVKRFYPLMNKSMSLTKIYGTNPLAIGGIPRVSFREFVPPAYESDIRYHLNYVSDLGLTPCTYYNVINGKIVPIKNDIPKKISDELYKAFANESKEELEMLDRYMPNLFQEFPDILRVAFDIEIDSERNKLPNPNNPIEAIISIAIVDTDGRKKCFVLNRDQVKQDFEFDDIDIQRFNNEKDLLLDFYDTIDKYPVVLSFNGDGFDCPYLVNRSIRLGINKVDIPIKLRRNDASFENSVHLDLYQFFKQASVRLYAFGGKYERSSLDELSRILLGEGKIEHPKEWINEMDLKNLVNYNVKDSELTLRLTQFDNNIALNLMYILIRISKMPIFDFSRSAVSRWLHMWIVYEHRQRDYLIPLKVDILKQKGSIATSSATIDGKNFQGAIVLDPKPGVWWDVHVLDFASLYPSIIKTRNLSYETIKCDHDECKTNIVPEVNHWVCTKKQGMFSILLGFVRDTRVMWFKPRSEDKLLSELERRRNNIIQASLKVLINAGYGVLGSENFDFYCLPVAESTTAYARDAIKATRDYVEQNLHIDVLYGDTDSVFIYQPKPSDVENLKDWSMKNIGIELGVDYEFRYVVFSDRKKNYFGITKDNKIIVKGLMGKKSNTPNIIRAAFSQMLEILKNVYSLDDLENAKDTIYQLLRSLINKLNKKQFTKEDATVRLTLSKKLKDYGTWTQTVQVAAQLISKGIRKIEDISIGDSLQFVKVRNPVRVTIPGGFAFSPGTVKECTVIPIELVNDDKLEGKPLIAIAESTFSHILDTLDISWDKIIGLQSLDEFF